MPSELQEKLLFSMPPTQTNVEIGLERRARILEFFAAFTAEHGHSPTVREVAQGVGMVSPGPTHKQLQRLVREGKLVQVRVTTRTCVYALPEL